MSTRIDAGRGAPDSKPAHTEDPGEGRLRKGWVAFLFSAFNPGLGHLYAGRPIRGLLWYIFSMGASFGALYFLTVATPARLELALGVLIAVLLLLPIVVGIDGFFAAKRAGFVRLKKYQHWAIYCSYVVLSMFLITPSIIKAVEQHVLETYDMTDDSMSPAVRSGDLFLALRPTVTGNLFQRGDVIIFRPSGHDDDWNVKRVIGLPGEIVEVRSDAVFVNGAKLCESYARWGNTPNATFPPTLIPERSLFVLGDNRGKSNDSRTFTEPFVPFDAFLGRAQLIYMNQQGDFQNVGVHLSPPPSYPETCE